jgi:hypothetical protein
MHTVEARETVASEVRFESRSHVSGLVRISGWRCPQAPAASTSYAAVAAASVDCNSDAPPRMIVRYRHIIDSIP